ncbi:hypothetical protein Poli38472_005914 [Pythium oligandrum]|uniref:Uncharacterized protein n=1 Tax=Pythium oligandrum TaxID=41045 RepID=A0A8K1FMN9_PYTOL|nr:hypothetical protein Poli38472_005914 [Pythium oligandrum]|eukprot:TMW68446.1 hypothetical protein Poli38472_005914 [Pythium oligandrum]
MNGAPTQLDAPTSDDYWKNEYKRRADFGKSAAASVLLRTQVLTLSEYRNEARRPPLPRETLIAQYGSIFVPIPISLADEETLEDYEMSFQDWLINRGIKTSDLKRDARLERTLRCDFALLKATGGKGSSSVAKPQVPSRVIAPAPTTVHVNKKKEKVRKPTSAFVPVAKQAEAKEESSKQIPVPEDPYGFPECCSVQLPPSSATLEALITAYTGCGCRNCLRHCTLRMAERVTQLEEADRASRAVKHKKRARIEPDEPPSPPTQPAAIIESNEQTTNRPDDFDFSLIGLASKRARLLEATSTVPSSHRTQSTEDPIETRLIHRFDKLNELVLTSERKLETLMAEKPNNHPKKKLTKVHELQQKISSDKEARTASLVVAVVNLWRHDEKELLEMTSTSEIRSRGVQWAETTRKSPPSRFS